MLLEPTLDLARSHDTLAQAFANLAASGTDLAAVTVRAPRLTEPPALDHAKGMLRLKGYFPGEPLQINFELLYQSVEGRWRLFGLSVQPGGPPPPMVTKQ